MQRVQVPLPSYQEPRTLSQRPGTSTRFSKPQRLHLGGPCTGRAVPQPRSTPGAGGQRPHRRTPAAGLRNALRSWDLISSSGTPGWGGCTQLGGNGKSDHRLEIPRARGWAGNAATRRAPPRRAPRGRARTQARGRKARARAGPGRHGGESARGSGRWRRKRRGRRASGSEVVKAAAAPDWAGLGTSEGRGRRVER